MGGVLVFGLWLNVAQGFAETGQSWRRDVFLRCPQTGPVCARTRIYIYIYPRADALRLAGRGGGPPIKPTGAEYPQELHGYVRDGTPASPVTLRRACCRRRHYLNAKAISTENF